MAPVTPDLLASIDHYMPSGKLDPVWIPSAVSSRIPAHDRAQAIVCLRTRLSRESAPVRRRFLQAELREMESLV